MFANSFEIWGREEGRGYRSETAVSSAWMMYDKVLFLGSLIIWHRSKSSSFSAEFIFLTLSNKAQLLPRVSNERVCGHFDFGLISAFVSPFFLSWAFMEKDTVQWLWSHLPAGHVFEIGVGIKNCYHVPPLWNKLEFISWNDALLAAVTNRVAAGEVILHGYTGVYR